MPWYEVGGFTFSVLFFYHLTRTVGGCCTAARIQARLGINSIFVFHLCRDQMGKWFGESVLQWLSFRVLLQKQHNLILLLQHVWGGGFFVWFLCFVLFFLVALVHFAFSFDYRSEYIVVLCNGLPSYFSG